MTGRRHITAAVALAAFATLASPGARAASYAMSYAAQILRADGTPVDGPIDLRITFYDAASGGNQVMAPIRQQGLAVSGGVVQLNIELTDDKWHLLFPTADAERYVELHDETHGITTPRQRFGVIPFALKVPVDGATIGYDATTGGLKFAPTATVNMASQRLTGLAEPDDASDAATKYYVDQAVAGAGVGGGITSLNGLTTATQTFAFGTTGTSAGFTSTGSTHTLRIPYVSDTGVTQGILRRSEYDALAGKQNALGYTPLDKGGDTMGGTLNMNGKPLTNLLAPSLGGDAVNKTYADGKLGGQPLTVAGANANDVLKWDGTTWAPAADNAGGTVTSVSATPPLAVATPTTTPALSITQATTSTDGFLSATDWNTFNAKQAALGYAPLNKAGDTMSGDLAMGGKKITGLGTPSVTGDAVNKGYADAALGGQPLSVTGASAGDVLKWSGSSWAPAADATGGTVTSVAIGTGPLSVATPSTTPTISISQAGPGSDGFLSTTDWTTFNAKQAALGYTPLDKAGDTMSGDLAMGGKKITNLAAPSAAGEAVNKGYADGKLGGLALSVSGLATNDFLRWNGSNWAPAAVGGGGTVTSVTVSSGPLSIATPTTTPSITMTQADGANDGFLSATDWSAFDAKQAALGYTPLDKAGDAMSGDLAMSGNRITGLGAPTGPDDAATRQYVDDAAAAKQNVIGAATALTAASLTTSATVGVTVGNTGPASGVLRFLQPTDSGGGFVGLRAPNNITSSVIYQLPEQDGTPNQLLTTDGSGKLSWSTPAASVGDMAASVWDTDANGKVDAADTAVSATDSGKLGGNTGAFYLNADNHTDGANYVRYSTAEKTKLAGIAAGAGVVDAASVSGAGAVMDADFTVNGLMARTGTGAYSTVAAGADGAVVISDGTGFSTKAVSGDATLASNGTLTLATSGATQGSYTNADVTVDAKGRVTSVASGVVDLDSAETSGVLPIAKGGTGTATATANTVFAGPSNGGPVPPTFRALVGDDIPVMLGADGATPGKRGAAPTPAAADNLKFLRGDGTWQTPPAGSPAYGADGGVAADTVYVNVAGKVGIGTTSPAAKLDVVGTINAESICDENGANCKDLSTGWSAGAGDVVSGGQTGALTIGTNDSSALSLETNNATRVTIEAAGNVGIGTNSPGALLDVNGATKTSTVQVTNSTPPTCSAATVGTIFKSASGHALLTCVAASGGYRKALVSGALPHHVVFVTNGSYQPGAAYTGANTRFASVSQADDICAAEAAANGAFPTNMSFKAIISAAGVNAKDRIEIITAVFDDTLLAHSADQFWSGKILNSFNTRVDSNFISTATAYWTGSTPAGVASATHCTSWSLASGTGTTGSSDFYLTGAIESTTTNCSQAKPLVCISQY